MISGHTQLCFLLADPVEHVRTPQLFNAYLGAKGIDAVVVALNVERAALARVVAGLRDVRNLRAIIITLPHKIAMVELCDALHESARRVGAVNMVRRDGDGRLTGANFDGSGFVTALEAQIGPVAGRTVFMAGAGGVARPIAFEVARAGAARLLLTNRSAAKAEALLAEVARAFPSTSVACATTPPRDCDVAINATSLGLHPKDPLPFPVDVLPAHAAVAEVVMQPLITPLLAAASERGLRIVAGDGMLTAQLPFWMEFLGFEHTHATASNTIAAH
ncbi:MAG TPA: shikimate dehydrogenase [Casimicrobiaceae bacterium]|nr:shikimate dehydrogenase [Casimicrobiaceae bacterium]